MAIEEVNKQKSRAEAAPGLLNPRWGLTVFKAVRFCRYMTISKIRNQFARHHRLAICSMALVFAMIAKLPMYFEVEVGSFDKGKPYQWLPLEFPRILHHYLKRSSVALRLRFESEDIWNSNSYLACPRRKGLCPIGGGVSLGHCIATNQTCSGKQNSELSIHWPPQSILSCKYAFK